MAVLDGKIELAAHVFKGWTYADFVDMPLKELDVWYDRAVEQLEIQQGINDPENKNNAIDDAKMGEVI